MLPECDRAAVARSLAKNPDERFPSCLAFIRALSGAPASGSGSGGGTNGSNGGGAPTQPRTAR